MSETPRKLPHNYHSNGRETPMNGSNGMSRTQKITAGSVGGGLAAVLLAAATAWAQSVHVDASVSAERAGRVEQRVTDLEKRHDRFEDQVNAKLDKILFELRRK